MPREIGTSVTIGGQSPNYLYIDWSTVDDAPNNRTLVYWAAGFKYTNSDAQLDDCDISLAGLRYDNAGRVKNFNSNFTTRDHPIVAWNTPGYSAFYVGHDANGNGSMVISGSIGGNLGGRSTISARTVTFTNYDRTPTTPSFSSGARNTTGTSFSTTAGSWSGGVNNGGPQVTWTLQRSTVSNFSSGIVDIQSTTTSGATLTSSSLDPNTTYYYRIQASNSDTGNVSIHPNPKFSGIITSPGVPGPPTSLTVTPSTTSESRVSLSWTAPSNTQGGISRYDVFVNDVFVESTTATSLTSVRLNSGGTAFTPGTSYNFRVASKNATNLNETAISNVSSSVTSNVSAIAPGEPYAPTAPPTFTVNGLDITVTSAEVSGNGGVAISTGTANQGYYVQYQTSTTIDGTYGFGGVSGAWSTAVKMSDQANRRHTYSSLTPAIFYKFRTYAANTVTFASNGSTQLYYPHNNSSFTANFATTTTGYFLAAGGRRWTGTAWEPTAIAKRWDGNSWVAFTIAKRWDGNNWVNLS
jgi:hypothetical protein